MSESEILDAIAESACPFIPIVISDGKAQRRIISKELPVSYHLCIHDGLSQRYSSVRIAPFSRFLIFSQDSTSKILLFFSIIDSCTGDAGFDTSFIRFKK